MSFRSTTLARAIFVLCGISGVGLLLGASAPPADSTGLADTPWPMYRHDPAHTSFNGAKGPATDRLKWVFSTGKAEKEGGFENDVTIGPDGTLYIGSNNGVLYGLDPESGAVRWVHLSAFDTFAIYSTAAVGSRGLVYYGAKDGYLYALRPPKRGIAMEVVWRFDVGTTIETSPVIGPDGTVYIGADDWKLYAIAPPKGSKSARLKWTFQTGGTLISSPALDADGTVYIGSMDGSLYALSDRGAGKPPARKWTFSTGKRDAAGGIETSPVLTRDVVLIGGNDGVLYALGRAAGSVRWWLKTWYDSYGIFSNPAVGPDGTLYFGPKDGRLLAVTPQGKISWEYKIGTTIETSPAVGADGIVYLGADDGRLYAVKPPSGGLWGGGPQLLWRFQTQGTLIGSPVLDSDGTLYQPSMDGKLYAFHDSAEAAEAPAGLTGTWYGGLYGSDRGEAKPVTVVAVERSGRVEAAWRFASGATGSASGTVEARRLSLKGEASLKGCLGAVRVTGKVEGEKVVGSYAVEGCPGIKHARGTFELSR